MGIKYKDMSLEQKAVYCAAALQYYHANKEQCAIKAKNWRLDNKEYIRQKQREDKRERKELAIRYLGGYCQKCLQIFHPACFEFHHRNPIEKDRDPSKMLSLSWERLKTELDKCDLLCANCHRLTHHMENYKWNDNISKQVLQKESLDSSTPVAPEIPGEHSANVL